MTTETQRKAAFNFLCVSVDFCGSVVYNSTAVAMHPEKPDRRSVWLKQAGLLTAIPFVLLAGPALGYLVGSAADRRWPPASPWGTVAGIVLGLAASARTTAQLIRQARDLQ